MSKSIITVISSLVSVHLLLVAMTGALACDENHEWAATHDHASVGCGDHHGAPLGGSTEEGDSPCLVHLCTCGHVSVPPYEFSVDLVPAAGMPLSVFEREIWIESCTSTIDRPPRTIA